MIGMILPFCCSSKTECQLDLGNFQLKDICLRALAVLEGDQVTGCWQRSRLSRLPRSKIYSTEKAKIRASSRSKCFATALELHWWIFLTRMPSEIWSRRSNKRNARLESNQVGLTFYISFYCCFSFSNRSANNALRLMCQMYFIKCVSSERA